MKRHLFPILLPLLLSFSAGAASNDVKAVTAGDLSIDLQPLTIQLRPLPADQLAAEADAWQEALQAKVQELSDAQVVALTAEDGTKADIEKKIAELTDQRIDIADRMQAVLAEWETKGGDARSHRQYIDAVSGLALNTADGGAGIAKSALQWLKSEKGGIRWGINLIKFLVILIIARILANFIARLLRKVLDRSGGKLSDLLKEFIVNTTRRLVFFLGLIIALSALGVNIGPLLAGIGVLGFILGFALQDTLGNFAAGFMILINRPYDVGDLVEIDGNIGKVSSMNLVSTTLNTQDNQRIVIPNGSIWGGTIKNITGNDTRRVDMMFGIGYDDDIEKGQKVLEEIVNNCDKVLKSPTPNIAIHELADSSVNYICRPWCKTSDYWDVYWEIHREVKRRFDIEGLSIPFPQSDVHMHTVEK